MLSRLSLVAMLCFATVTALAAERPVYSPAVREAEQPMRLLWGDTHLHTRWSGDAYMTGTTAFTPEQAYRFARGETVVSTTGVHAALREPLDFLVITDHGEFLGLFAATEDRDDAFLKTALGRRWRAFMDANDVASIFLDFQRMIYGDDADRSDQATRLDMWQRAASLADQYNAPGRFSALIGYEWSSTPGNSNLHRNVIFRDGAEKAGSRAPFTAVDSKDPEDLWHAMAQYENETDGHVLAIPHNGNLSNGLMFAETTFDGARLSADYARRRARWEPVVEVTQIKGDGEAHPMLSPDDAFADYETWDAGNFPAREGAQPKEPWMLKYEYARAALKQGLLLEQQLGINPFQFGMIGSTDAHTGLSAVEEDNFFGKFPESEPNSERSSSNMQWLGWPNATLAASGLAAVWATENTREAIFDAMRRREVYATTGPRIGVRLFGGWRFVEGDADRSDFVSHGYRHGVPMGGELTAIKGSAPAFVVVATRDPNGALLDRVQIVKGWLSADGELHERVFDVAVSSERRIDPATGTAPVIQSTVDTERARYRQRPGAAELRAVWQDPAYVASEPAFYYARVLQIPTPRWPAYDKQVFANQPAAGAELITQDRAYSSPIWIRPTTAAMDAEH